jgi:succinate dehydrogenase / fumarate reductase cytochrome b subunit
MSTLSTTASADRGFIRARLGSFLAVVPLGVWTFFHVWSQLAAFQGGDAWTASVTTYAHPAAQLATGLIVLLPLLIHAVWGIARLFSAKPNNVRYGFYGNLKYAMQRLTAIGVLFFLGAHLWLAMLQPRLMEGHAEAFADISHEMHFHTPTLIVYLLGTLGVAYHLANGLQTFAMGWGLVSTRRALKKLDALSIGFFLLLTAMAWGAIYALWSAGAAA